MDSTNDRQIKRARIFLLVAGSLFLVFFALPILFIPYTWAGWFSWDSVVHNDLTTYFARSLGAVATAISGVAIYASFSPARYRALFQIVTITAVLLALVHLWGLIQSSQPWTEDVEVLLYAALALLSHWCMPK